MIDNKDMSMHCCLIGETTLLLECAKHLLEKKHYTVSLITTDPTIITWANERNIPNYSHYESFLAHSLAFDYLWSINNRQVLPLAFIKKAQKLAINYHDAPLPDYAGVNATAWAIINGEEKHAITWHLMSEKIDSGDILLQDWVDISSEETTVSLNLKCYQLAIHSFQQLVEKIVNNDLSATTQNLNKRRYFAVAKKPSYGGIIKLSSSLATISRLVRGLSFGVFDNPLALPKLIIKNELWSFKTIAPNHKTYDAPPGEIIAIQEDNLLISIKNNSLWLKDVYCLTDSSQKVENSLLGQPINDLTKNFFNRINSMVKIIAKHEHFWLTVLQKMIPLKLPPHLFFSKKNKNSSVIAHQLNHKILHLATHYKKDVEIIILSLILIYLSRACQQNLITISIDCRDYLGLDDEMSKIFSPIVPFNIDVPSEGNFSEVITSVNLSFKKIKSQGTFLRDLCYRYSSLSNFFNNGLLNTSLIYSFTQNYKENPLGTLPTLYLDSKKIISHQIEITILLTHLNALINDLLSNPKKTIKTLNIIPEAEKKLFFQINQTQEDINHNQTLDTLFITHAVTQPNQPAIFSGDQPISYYELYEYAQNIASQIKFTDRSLIGICLPKTWKQVAACVAVSMTQHAFVPLNIHDPVSRRQQIIDSCQINLVIDEFNFDSLLRSTKKNPILITKRNSQNLAYIIHTSGSTGQPKGVMISHANAMNTILAVNKKWNIQQYDRVLTISALNFDLAIYDIFGILSAGGSIVIPEENTKRSPQHWLQLINQHNITIWNSVPTYMQLLVEYCLKENIALPKSLRCIFLSGDYTPISLAKNILLKSSSINLINLGGATEASIWSIYYHIKKIHPAMTNIPYGYPLTNQSFFILDKNLQPVPIGVIGDLYIGGAGVGIGYWDSPEKTKAAFMTQPETNHRLYKTGDLGYYQSQGEIIFCGRVDTQIKINGFRIELGEIEAALNKIPEILNAVAIIDYHIGTKKPYIIAFLQITQNTILSLTKIKRVLNSYLPSYMMPHMFRRIHILPLNSNGKLDRNKLTNESGELIIEKTKTNIKDKSFAILSKALTTILHLNPKEIKATATFYELGGDSLVALKTVSHLAELGFNIKIEEFFQQKTLVQIAQQLIPGKNLKNSENIIENQYSLTKNFINTPGISSIDYPLTETQAGIIYQCELDPNPKLYKIHLTLNLIGTLDQVKFQNILSHLIHNLAIFRQGFRDDTLSYSFTQEASECYEYIDLQLIQDKKIFIEKIISKKKAELSYLSKSPLIRIILFKLTEENYQLSLISHHILLDGISLYSLAKTLLLAYTNFAKYTNLILHQSSVRSVSEQIPLTQYDEDYWCNLLLPFIQNNIFINHLPSSNNQFSSCSTIFSYQQESPNTSFIEQIYQSCIIALAKFYRKRFICIGIPVSTNKNIDTVIGMFVHPMPLFIDTQNNIIEQLQTQLNYIRSHDTLQETDIKRILNLPYNTSFFDIFIIVDNFSETLINEKFSSHLQVNEISLQGLTHYPVVLTITKQQNNLLLQIDFTNKLINSAIAENILEILKSCLIESFLLQKEANKSMLTQESFSTQFSEIIKKHGENIAIEHNNKKISYTKLDEKTNKFISLLLEKEISPGARILIALKRSIDLVALILAVMKLKAIFIPIDYNIPKNLFNHILNDIDPTLIITDNSEYVQSCSPYPVILLQSLKESNNLNISNLEYNHTNENEIAYVIYTSGTTGYPKGVIVHAKGLINVLYSIAQHVELQAGDRVAALSSIAFDISLLELLMPLLYGATVVLIDREIVRDGQQLAKALDVNLVNLIQTTPSVWQSLIAHGWQGGKHIKALCGGEILSTDLASTLLSRVSRLWNVYGPTETTIWSTIAEIHLPSPNIIPIGKPINQTSCLIFHQNELISTPNKVGELYIGGIGVAQGYLNKPSLTQKSFVTLANQPYERYYKTGDLVQYNQAGNLIFIGRHDRQIKLRGHRIELDAIEAKLSQHPDISEVAVEYLKNAQGENEIVAFIKPLTNKLAPLKFSLFFFAASEENYADHYDLYLKAARFADQNEFSAIWTPERHFDVVGGPYPNPSVLSAAAAVQTQSIKIHAGSVVLPLHHPARIAEEWAMIDNLSGGRAGIALASGWHPQDFILAPGKFAERKTSFKNSIEVLQQLWAGQVVEFPDGTNQFRSIRTYPRPIQSHLPLWITAAGNAETFIFAGEMGANLLTHLLEQDLDSLAEKITLYRHALARQGIAPDSRTVTLMIHTFVGESHEETQQIAYQPFYQYLSSHLNLLQRISHLNSSEDNKNNTIIIEKAIARYFSGYTLIGDHPYCIELLKKLSHIGINEIACLIDFGIPKEKILNSLISLKSLRQKQGDFFSVSKKTLNFEEIRTYLISELPDYMIPTRVISLDHLPRTMNDKINRTALAEIFLTSVNTTHKNKEDKKNLTSYEITEISNIWKSVLGNNTIGINENFFEIGGHSLLATQIISRLRKQFSVDISLLEFFEQPTIFNLSQVISKKLGSKLHFEISTHDRSGLFSLSYAQERMYFLYKAEPLSLRYNDAFAHEILGPINYHHLVKSIQTLAERHEVLRTMFIDSTTGTRQRVLSIHNLKIEVPVISVENNKEYIYQTLYSLAEKPFQLENPPLFRIKLLKIAEDHHILLICLHHIVTDGWSMSIFLRDLSIAYKAFNMEHSLQSLPLAIQYGDYAISQRQHEENDILLTQINFWKQHLSKEIKPLNLLTDYIRPLTERFHGNKYSFSLTKVQTEKINDFCKQKQITTFAFLFSVYAVFLTKITKQDGFVIGIPIANRNYLEIEDLVGSFVNILPIKVEVDMNNPVSDFIAHINKTIFLAATHQDAPIEKIIKEILSNRDTSQHAVFQTMMVLHNTPPRILDLGNKVIVRDYDFHLNLSRMDIILGIEEKTETIHAYFEYNTDLFAPETIENFTNYLSNLIDLILLDSNKSLEKLSLLKQENYPINLIHAAKQKEYQYSPLSDQWQVTVNKYPNKLAIKSTTEALTFSELNDLSNKYIYYLMSHRITISDRVLFICNRDITLITFLLATMRLGAIYTVLDEDQSAHRIKTILNHLNPKAIITDSEPTYLADISYSGTILILNKEELQKINKIDKNNNVCIPPDHSLYICYTSGTTGEPKGVMISHQAVDQFAKNYYRFGLTENDNIAQLSTLAFDASTFEIWLSLLNGMSISIIQKESLLNPVIFMKTLKELSVTACYFNAGLLQKYLTICPEAFSSLKTLVFGGEILDLATLKSYLASDILKPTYLINGYGPTEATTFATIYHVNTISTTQRFLPIGQPLDFTQVLLLDEYLNLVPPNVPGEIYLAGPGLTTGYWQNSQQTQQAIIEINNHIGCIKGYRTGDLAYWDSSNNLVLIGRVDEQIKLRGHRIEPADIVQKIIEHPLVSNAVIKLHEEQADKQLVAYIEKKITHQQHLEMWKNLYQDLYNFDINDSSEFVGWNSSYDNKPYSINEMQDWVKDTVTKLQKLKPRRILEIGVGTGLIARELISNCELYVGIDFIEQILDYFKKHIAPESEQLKLYCLDASEFDSIIERDFDLIIINSVCQYFPDIDFFTTIIEKAIQLLLPFNGYLFIGDVRNFDLAEIFHASLLKLQQNKSIDILNEINLRIEQEYELLISPEFFNQLYQNNHSIKNIKMLLKNSQYSTEMSRYRFDVLITTKEAHYKEPNWVDWGKELSSLIDIITQLSKEPQKTLGIRNIINKRLLDDINFFRSLTECKQRLDSSLLEPSLAIDPYDLTNLIKNNNLYIETYIGDSIHTFDAIISSNEENFTKIHYNFNQKINYSNKPTKTKISAEDLHSFLAQKIPQYMLPQRYVFLDKFPLNINGKIDHTALKELAISVSNQQKIAELPAGTNMEDILLKLWKEVLRNPSITIDDNFFSVGGDSIICIHLIAKARAFDIDLTPKKIFQYQTIRQLAKQITSSNKKEIVKIKEYGEIPLTPIQHWFFDMKFSENHHWNQAYLFQVKQKIDFNSLETAWKILLDHHDSLRIRYNYIKDTKKWQQYYSNDYKNLALEYICLTESTVKETAKTLTAYADQAQAGLDLTQGPLIRVVLFDLLNINEQRLLIVIHHLLVDSVSWYILFEDLMILLKSANLPPATVKLPASTLSFKSWSEYLLFYATQPLLLQQFDYWHQLKSVKDTLFIDHQHGLNTNDSTAHVKIKIDQITTQHILTNILENYHCKINDVLLTALSCAFKIWQKEGILVNIDSHGRPPLADNIDVTRTVGWFTATYPLYLDTDPDHLEQSLRNIHQLLNNVPDDGIGYGVLRYLSTNSFIKNEMNALPIAPVGFNYFGQYFRNIGGDNLFDRTTESPGAYRSPRARRLHLIEINGYLYENELHFDFAYSLNFHLPQTIENLATHFQFFLQKLAKLIPNTQKKYSLNQLITLQAQGNKIPIYLIHPIGGQVHWYRELVDALGIAQPCYGLKAVGIDDDQPPLATIEELAECYLLNILQHTPNDSYIIGGWSFGCEIAFELSKRLIDLGKKVPLTIIIDPQTLLQRCEIIANGLQWSLQNEYGIILDNSPIDISISSIDEYLAYLLQKLPVRLSVDGKTTEFNFLKNIFKLYCTHLKAFNQYQKTGIVNKILLFKATELFTETSLAITSPAPLNSWQTYSLEKINHVELAGNHYSILKNEAAKKIAATIKALLLGMGL